MRRRQPRQPDRVETLRDALMPLAEKGVTGEQAMALIMAAGAALRQGVGLDWRQIEDICTAVFGTFLPPASD